MKVVNLQKTNWFISRPVASTKNRRIKWTTNFIS